MRAFPTTSCVCLALSCIPAATRANIPLTPVAVSGQPAPGVSGGATFSRVSTPTVMPSGEIGFHGAFVRPNEEQAYWVGLPGDLRIVAQQGLPAPGTTDALTALYGPWGPTEGGVVFTARLANDAWSSGSWRVHGNSLQAILIAGDPAPGIPGGFIGGSRPSGLNPTTNRNGQVLVESSVHGGSIGEQSNSALFFGTPGNLALVLREGDPAPVGVGNAFPDFGSNTIRLNDAAVFSIALSLRGGDVPYAVFVGTPGEMKPVARFGDPVPGAGGELRLGTVNILGAPMPDGEVIFGADLRGADGNFDRDYYGVFQAGPDAIRTIVRPGMAAPGTDARFTDRGPEYVGYFPHSNTHGDVVFRGRLEGDGVTPDNDRGVWTGSVKGLKLIAREDDQAPGLAPGTRFGQIDAPNIRNVAINDAGHIVFGAFLAGPDVNARNDGSIWAAGPDGHLTLVAREGDYVDVGGGERWQIVTLFDDYLSLGDRGELAFTVGFGGSSSGVFYTVIPEPATLSLLAATLALVLWRRDPPRASSSHRW